MKPLPCPVIHNSRLLGWYTGKYYAEWIKEKYWRFVLMPELGTYLIGPIETPEQDKYFHTETVEFRVEPLRIIGTDGVYVLIPCRTPLPNELWERADWEEVTFREKIMEALGLDED